MSHKIQSDLIASMWSALGQIVPYVESQDTLGTIIATALHEIIRLGKVAVILRSQPLVLPDDSSTYYLRLIGDNRTSSQPIYLDGDIGILERIDSLKEPLYLNYPWPESLSSTHDKLLALATDNIVLVPISGSDLISNSHSPGAICLIDVPKEHHPPPGELLAIASFTGLALHLVTSKSQAARQAVEYSIISEIGRSLTSSLSTEDIFDQILSSVRAAIDASEVSVGFIDHEKKEIIFEKSLMGPWFEPLPTLRLKMGQGVAGWVAQTGEALNVPDAYKDPRFYQGADRESGFKTHSILCVPLKVEGQVIGVLEAVNKKGGYFTNADKRLLSALGSSAAIAIEKAHLHENVLSEKRRMDAIFAHMGEGLMTLDLEGRILTINPAMVSILRKPVEELVGKDCRAVIVTEPAVMDNLIDQTSNQGVHADVFHAACDMIHADGSRTPVLINGSATQDVTGAMMEIVVVFSNITQLRELERMKDDFIANVTHELRTPLATILLYARLLRGGKKVDPEREDRYLGIVEQQSNHLQKLVRKILDLSRLESTLTYMTTEQIDLTDLFNNLLPPCEKMAAQKDLKMVVNITDDLPKLKGSSDAVNLIVKNLIDNAIKFTQQGEITISVYPCGDCVQIEISDEGIGISSESMPHLFQRFYRTKATVELGIGGTGLGLALVKEATERLGGTISVESEPEKGSTFTVQLPIAYNGD
ncbi:MAG: GAF domain-containing protein [Anaerolineales bacterium]|nr:GAF domain-containing protein [Anaerolineales bacterium]